MLTKVIAWAGAITACGAAALAMLCLFLAGWWALLRFAGFRADWLDKYSAETGSSKQSSRKEE